jgi:rhodanese-related sulfurtransferase
MRIELIHPDALASRRDSREPLLVLDVREDDEFREAHIPGSIHIPYGELLERLGELPRDRPIAAVCSGGKRSGLAASLLQRDGFEGVVHIGNGVDGWRDRGHPVETG